MKPNRLLFLLPLVLSGCVTINIYFPAAAAEKAADRIIDEIMQKPGTPASAHDKTAAPLPQPAQGDKK